MIRLRSRETETAVLSDPMKNWCWFLTLRSCFLDDAKQEKQMKGKVFFLSLGGLEGSAPPTQKSPTSAEEEEGSLGGSPPTLKCSRKGSNLASGMFHDFTTYWLSSPAAVKYSKVVTESFWAKDNVIICTCGRNFPAGSLQNAEMKVFSMMMNSHQQQALYSWESPWLLPFREAGHHRAGSDKGRSEQRWSKKSFFKSGFSWNAFVCPFAWSSV